MRSHPSTILTRAIKTALRSPCRYKVVAIGLDSKNRLISIATNSHRFTNRGYHAEERLIAKSPKSLSKIILGRVGSTGELLPIHPCKTCSKLLEKYSITVLSLEDYI